MLVSGAAIDGMRRALESAQCRDTSGRPEKMSGGFWSALQTHLQGVDRATLAVMPEMIRSHAQPSLSARVSVSK
jgi:hypothetical protein